MPLANVKSGDLLWVIDFSEMWDAHASYEDWLFWKSSYNNRLVTVLSVSKTDSNNLEVLCDGSVVWMTKRFLKEV